jgi:1-acyl-sn-glycerol-3-phosphate acyltransferase
VKRLVNWILKIIIDLICRVDDSEISKIPMHGPLILIGNHVNFLEVPVMYLYLLPREMTGFAAAKSWKNPFLSFLFNLWDAIPLRRWEADIAALKEGIKALRCRKILAIAPEGTRSGDGKLQVGNPGVVLLALKSGAPLLPVAYNGGEKIWQNLRKLRRTDFHVAVGQPFILARETARISSEVRQQMLNEIMYQLASILPEEYRGVYSDLDNSTQDFIEFVNLK